MYAIIRIRGSVNTTPDVKKTFELLNLSKVNNMSIWPENKQTLKMIKSVENYSTFGVISDELVKEVIAKRGKSIKGEVDLEKAASEVLKGKKFKEVNLKNCFRLSPPKGGHARKGVKKPFTLGGALGNRKDKIDDLIKKMM